MCVGHLEEVFDSETTKQFFRRYSANEVPQPESRYKLLVWSFETQKPKKSFWYYLVENSNAVMANLFSAVLLIHFQNNKAKTVKEKDMTTEWPKRQKPLFTFSW